MGRRWPDAREAQIAERIEASEVPCRMFYSLVIFLLPSPSSLTDRSTHPYIQWLLSRYERAQVDPNYAYPQPVYGVYRPVYGNTTGGGAEYYGMHSMPPPVYDPSRPPVYDGPPGGSKVDPVQERQGQAPTGAGEYAPPAGPPPGAAAR